jgi:hypothetical protein
VENGYNVEQNPLIKTTDNIREGAQPDYLQNLSYVGTSLSFTITD